MRGGRGRGGRGGRGRGGDYRNNYRDDYNYRGGRRNDKYQS